jgi:hypothetical protein
MLKTLVTGTCLILLAACASTPKSEPPKSAALAAKPPAGCVSHTATRLPRTDTDCAEFGQSYDQDDLKRTGYPDVGQALRNIDPSIHP